MIYFISEVLDGETDILRNFKNETLEFYSLEGDLIKKIEAPRGGWSHERLNDVAAKNREATSNGADAYLGRQWVGSTEV